jgi:hypothetical protein
MRRLFVLATAAAAFALAAGVVVAAPPSVTLKASPTTVGYGGSTTLSGALSNQRTGQTVTVEQQECGKTSFSRLATVTTTSGGAWSFVAKPTLNTTYRAKFKSSTSTPVLVRVSPVVKLRKLALRRFSVAVTAAQSFQGKFVYFQRYRSSLHKWATVKRVTLTAVKTTTAPTMVSSARFRSKLKARLRIRAVLGQAQASPCYLGARSNVTRS